MPTNPPKLQVLTQWILNGSDRIESLGELPPNVWEISVPAKRSLMWSIILAYLIPAASSSDEFKMRLRNLISEGKELEGMKTKLKISRNTECKNIMKCVKAFNPFINRHNFYFNNTIIDIMRLFKLRLNRYALKLRNEEWNNNLKLKSAMRLLKCRIDVCLVESNGHRKLISYVDLSVEHQSMGIILFQNEGIDHKDRKMDVFNFAMPTEVASKLRFAAIGFIFKKAKVTEEKIAGVIKDITLKDNFLTCVLNSPHIDIIPTLYASPYIPLKLAEASFETDPRVVDRNGFSALFYAMCSANSNYLNILYDYAINSCHLLETNVRNPDSFIQDNVLKIGEIMKNDRENSLHYNIDDNYRQHVSKTCFEFLCFNDYQYQIVNDIDKQRQMTKSNLPSIEETEQIKKNIISIFQNYDNCSYCGSPNTEDISDLFYNYVKFSEYYENMDYFTCLLFYDQMFLLSQGTPNTVLEIYPSLEKSLFLTILGTKMFPKHKHIFCENCTKDVDDCEREKNVLRFIPFHYRLKFLKNAKDFRKLLENTKIDEKKLEQYSADIFRNCFSTSCVIKDEFLISRLKTYLKAAIEVSFDENPSKAVLAIERGLQVLGESLHESSTDGCVVSYLLCSCLPPELEQNLFGIRNHIFSHYKANAVQGRLVVEQKNRNLLKLVQDELKMISKKFDLVYRSQHHRLTEFLIQKGLNVSKTNFGNHKLVQAVAVEFEKIAKMREEDFLLEDFKYMIGYFTSSIRMFGLFSQKEFKIIKRKMCALKFLLRFIFRNNHSEKTEYLMNILDVFYKFLNQNNDGVVTTETRDEMTELLNLIHRSLDLIFRDTEEESSKDLEYPNLNQLFKIIKDYKYFTDKEVSIIRKSLLNCLQTSCKAKLALEEALRETSLSLTRNEREVYFEQLITSRKLLDEVRSNFENNRNKALKALKKIKTSDDVTKVLGNTEDTESELLVINNDQRNALFKISFPLEIRKKILNFMNQKMEFILNRIQLLKKILIDEDDEISTLWTWGKSDAIKKHTRFLMAQRYLKEGDLRTSIEMLLFDCLNAIDPKNKSPLWNKVDNLFTGVKIRDFLSHGSAVLESVGGLLDSKDVPSEIVRMSLELIEDAESLRAMSDLFVKLKPLTTEDLEIIINYTGNDEFTVIREKIKKCKEWKSYLHILPPRPLK